jgi:hypothetical protein
VVEGLCLVAPGGSRRAGGGAEALDATDRRRRRENVAPSGGHRIVPPPPRVPPSRRVDRRPLRGPGSVSGGELRDDASDPSLPEALRLLMIKSDGSVLVRADMGRYKPYNCG